MGRPPHGRGSDPAWEAGDRGAGGAPVLEIPEPALVLTVGASGSGKTTFARRWFREPEVVSSDRCRYLLADDANDQSASGDAFELAFLIASLRLKRRRLAVLDSTGLDRRIRDRAAEVARSRRAPLVAVVFELPLEVLLERAAGRADRPVPADVIERQHRRVGLVRQLLLGPERHRYGAVHVLRGEAAVAGARVVRVPAPVAPIEGAEGGE